MDCYTDRQPKTAGHRQRGQTRQELPGRLPLHPASQPRHPARTRSCSSTHLHPFTPLGRQLGHQEREKKPPMYRFTGVLVCSGCTKDSPWTTLPLQQASRPVPSPTHPSPAQLHLQTPDCIICPHCHLLFPTSSTELCLVLVLPSTSFSFVDVFPPRSNTVAKR